ncbi:hypothetical protein CCACVL1_13313 [Corchorus capsularis]|uniref:Uncharacterized protein n=1 Tax=Corchorus capsularis TaxID=210143 RepID=A0A1R3IBH7_COCAP|nr:hypothetical protein CCACVL1_13313 [Corchorus capsularis]
MIFVKPFIEALSMKQVTTIAKLSDFIAFLYTIQAYSACHISIGNVP